MRLAGREGTSGQRRNFDIVDCSRTPRPASRACAKRARSPSRDTQTQRTVLPVRTNVIAVIPKIRSCDERARTCCSMGGGPMIADRSHSTSRVTVRGPAQSRTHGQDPGHGQALLSDPPNGTALHTALHTHDPTRSHSCTCPTGGGAPGAISKVMGRRQLLSSEREGHRQLQHTEASNAPHRRRRARGTSTSQSRRSRHENLASRRTCRHDEFASR